MFEEEDGQNGTQLGDQRMAARIASLLRVPQSSGQDDGEFVNPRFALRIDPNTGNAYRSLAGTPAQTAAGQNGLNGQNASGQTSAGQNPAYVPSIQTRDAQGKTLPKYRMGIGQRILATVANFANGFAGNGAAPIYAGPGALNNRYYQDEGTRQQQNDESPTLQGSGDRFRQAIDWRTIVQDPVSKKWYGKTYGGQKQEIGTPPWTGAGDGEDDGTNNDDGNEPPPIGTQVGPGSSSARQRFAEARGRKKRY